jgi:2-polyprenyl-6-methoxyphenol hydroxylase-like FAD-dependent oxidoreductase
MTTAMRPILIVGAGPVGLALAIQLRRFGVPVRLIERAERPSCDTKAMAIHARTLEILRDLGAVEPFLAHGLRVGRFRAETSGRAIMQYEFARLGTRYPFLLTLPQPLTERFLLARLHALDSAPAWGHTLSALKQDGDGVDALVRSPDGSERWERAAYLVGCDGARSVVRTELGLSFEGTSYERHFMLCDVDIDGKLARDEGKFFLGAGHGYVGMAPIPGERRYRFFVEVPGPLPPPEARPTLDLALFQQVVDGRGLDMRLANASSMTMAAFRQRMVPRLGVGRVFLAGDAAHIGSPIGGQYMNLGLQEAANLGWKLAYVARGHATCALLDSYHDERMPIARRAERTAQGLTRLLTLERPLLRAARNRILPWLCKLERVRDLLPRGISGHAQVYRGAGAIATQIAPARVRRVAEAKRTVKVCAGDLAPDMLRDADGEGARLVDRFDGTRLTVLLFAGEAAMNARLQLLVAVAARLSARYPDVVAPVIVWPGEAPSYAPEAVPLLVDRHGDLHARFGAESGGFYVVRPDGHLGYVGPDGIEPDLQRYLARTLSLRVADGDTALTRTLHELTEAAQ